MQKSKKIRLITLLCFGFFILFILFYKRNAIGLNNNKIKQFEVNNPENLLFRAEKLDNVIVDGMTYVENATMRLDKQNNLQVFLAGLSVNNGQIVPDNTIEALVTYNSEKKTEYLDYKLDGDRHFYFPYSEIDNIKNSYIYELEEVPAEKKSAGKISNPYCILKKYKLNGKEVRVVKNKKVDMGMLLKDKEDYFLANIIEIEDKNNIMIRYNGFSPEGGYGGIAVFNIKTGNIVSEIKTDFHIFSIDDNYIYGNDSKEDMDNAGTYYLANRKTGKVLDVEKNGKISNTEGFRKSFNKGKYYWISEDGKYIEEDIFNNRTRIIGVIEDNKYFEKYMLLAIKEKDENEFYAIYSTDWLKTNTNEFDGTQSNLFVVKYSKANI